MNNIIKNTLANAIDNKEDIKKRSDVGGQVLQELLACVQNCQNRFGGKSELATEDDMRIVQLCEKWEKVLSHGIKTNLSGSAIQTLVTAGLSLTNSYINIGNTIWCYTCLHLTKHEQERFKLLSKINTPLGYFRAFLRAALNERSLERYLHSWLGHGLAAEYYEDGALVRNPEASNLLPNMAAGLSSVLFALAIDRGALNDTTPPPPRRAEPVIPLPAPVRPCARRPPLRQLITFDEPAADGASRSAPPTVLSSPEPLPPPACASEPASAEHRSSLRHFFPDGVRMESPAQLLSKLSERAKEMFSPTAGAGAAGEGEGCERRLRLSSGSSSGSAAGSGAASCLELCLEDPPPAADAPEAREREYLQLQARYNELDHQTREKIHKLETVVLDLSKENERLKEQLRRYVAAVESGRAMQGGAGNDEERDLYEKKLIQVAEMHGELMEFNAHLSRRVRALEAAAGAGAAGAVGDEAGAGCGAAVHVPAAFLVGRRGRTHHVYQVFIKLGQEEWNVYHRYSKFHELHTHLRKCHPDIAAYKFPPKKALGKRESSLVEARRAALQAYLRLAVRALPPLRACRSRMELTTTLPFFGISSTSKESEIVSRGAIAQPPAAAAAAAAAAYAAL